MGWKKDLDPVLRDYLNSLLKEVEKYKHIYEKADDPGRAQIWIALAILYRKLLTLQGSVDKIEDIINYNEEDMKKILEETLKKL